MRAATTWFFADMCQRAKTGASLSKRAVAEVKREAAGILSTAGMRLDGRDASQAGDALTLSALDIGLLRRAMESR